MKLRNALAALAVLALLAGCGQAQPVSVLYAGSLVNLMEHQVGPAFTQATGYGYSGYAAGSVAIANQIKGKLRRGDVFISAAPAVNAGVASWYVAFAQAPLVIGYNPQSKFAADLRSKPWYQVMAEPGFRLGGTDPKLDPKGQLTAQLLQKVAPALLARLQVFPEEDLVGRLQAGQLDAGFFYANEAAEAKIPTVAIAGAPSATFTVTILAGAPDPSGAKAFVRYLLGAGGQALLKADGLTVLQPPQSHGQVPAGLLGG